MNSGEVCARHYKTGEAVRVRWTEGIISAVQPCDEPVLDRWIAPALVDLQVNGFGGVDFQLDGLGLHELESAAQSLRQAACSRFFLTLITDEWAAILRRFRHLRTLRSQSRLLQHAIAGWHIEGPFLSEEPGFCGAHDPNRMCDPTLRHIRELRAAGGKDALLLTVAPERPGAIAAIAEAVALGMTVSLGHTNAPARVLQEAIRAGATGFTHLGNGCPKELDRHDNILWRALDTTGLRISLIPDRIHVSPALFRLIHRTQNQSEIFYTADAMAAAGAPPGRYTIGRLRVEVGPDQIVRLPGKSNFAGSALQPIDGVRRAAEMLHRPWQEVWDHFSTTPASFAGLPHGLETGCPADLCVINSRDNASISVTDVWVRGMAAISMNASSQPPR